MTDGRGISQAEEMRRRVSPEGRRLARLEQQRRQRATWRLIGRCLLAALVVAVAAGIWTQMVGPLGQRGGSFALVLVALAWITLAITDRRRSPAAAAVAAAPLPALPATTGAWLAEQRRLLPAPAVTLVDAIGARIDALAPQVATLDPSTPAADELRKLLGTELPGLVGQYHAVPPSLRSAPGDAGPSPDARLLHGLGVVDRQLDELTRRLAAGAVDGLATHDRFLDSKYSGNAIG